MKVVAIKWQDTISVRHQVLWPHKPPEFCRVEGDEQALHFAVMGSQQIVCVASLYIDNNTARLRKFATLSAFQSKGVGSFMINYLIDNLKQQGINYLWFDARESALGFYQRFGFDKMGELFYKSDIAYYRMSKSL
ncbi:GNAT family N-acetyltransferase [Psychromonas sp. L1A2]|uniref:GNAT family N-acetyltransferase n=1 Tax=Psychromonas sp. L1A2 TaxID=2686356 RepID=UPI001359A5C6|nr:GNAT family N-acetyltransferase [Psychromonas sp. L1A2]